MDVSAKGSLTDCQGTLSKRLSLEATLGGSMHLRFWRYGHGREAHGPHQNWNPMISDCHAEPLNARSLSCSGVADRLAESATAPLA